MRAYRTSGGEVKLAKEPPDSWALRLPCGKCLGCTAANAKAWALRCHLENQQHRSAVFTTLTYAEDELPTTLDKQHLSGFFKTLRQNIHRRKAAKPIRFFGCGEYGEKRGRPHYHALIYGLHEREHRGMIEDSWGRGIATTEYITPERIAYTAGYTAKKIATTFQGSYEFVDPETGEVLVHFAKHTYHLGDHWQDQFKQMSRRPGIGAHARQWVNSWRITAVHNGIRQPVPRYLHEAWKAVATEEEKQALDLEKIKLAILRDTSEERLAAAEKIAQTAQQLSSRRRYL